MKFPYKHKVKNWYDYAPQRSKEYFRIAVRKTSNGYNGVFAMEDVPSGSVVGRTGGAVLSSIKDLPEKYDYPVLIDNGIFLGPPDYDNLETLSCLNHSCSSNLARIGGSILVAKKRIPKDTELTIDYAAFVAEMTPHYTLECRCGAKNCRGKIDTHDWKNPKIARQLWAEWLPFIQRKILKKGILRK
ncbi:MAG: SET domain-containing protein-lysine N-methyltransferase [Porticoccaceae bacterium]